MRKQIKKQLYTYYDVIGKLDEIQNDPNHILKSYSGGVAQCIKYHDSIGTWLIEIINNNFKKGFGIKVLTEDGERSVEVFRTDLHCNAYTCQNRSLEYIGQIMANIVTFYFQGPEYYYEIEDDNVMLRKEFTGHTYYRSIHESCDNCGTCDGARCDSCREKYIVEDLIEDKQYYVGYDKEDAERVYIDSQINYTEFMHYIIDAYNVDDDWFEKEIGSATNFKAVMKILTQYKIPYYVTR